MKMTSDLRRANLGLEPAPTGNEQPRRQDLPALFQLKKILVPVDFSECSKKALEYAIPFARQFGAQITLLNVAPPYLPMPAVAPFPAAVPLPVNAERENRRQLVTLRQTVGESIASAIQTRVGNAATEIVEAAKEAGIDLIVLATHGRTGLDHALMGSTAEKVVRHAPCPVLVVRQQEHDFIAPDAARDMAFGA